MMLRIAAALAAGLMAGAAGAGVYVESAERSAASETTLLAQRLYAQGGAVRLEQLRPDGTVEGITIFRDDVLYLVEPAERRYSAVDRATAQRVAAEIGSAMAEVRAQLARLPLDQRAMMERMMGGLAGGAGDVPVLEARDTGRSETVDGRSCRTWQVLLSGVVSSEMCVVPYSSLPGAEDLAAAMEGMASLMKEFTKAFAQLGGGDRGIEAIGEVRGFPVLTREFSDGRATGCETLVREWREQDVPASQFEVPAGFRERDLLEEMERSRR